MPPSLGIPELAMALRRARMGLESAGVTAEACSILSAETEALTRGVEFFRLLFAFLSLSSSPSLPSSNTSPAAAADFRKCSMGTIIASSPGRGL